MNVTIKERKFTLRSEYDISAPGVTYVAQKAFFSLPTRLELRTEDDRLVATLQSHLSIIHSEYDFVLADGRTYNFLNVKALKGIYDCTGPGESFHFYEHKGLRYSIFQGDRQIAAITRNRMVIGDGNEYDIRMNSDADVVVVSCMVLALNTAEDKDENDSTWTFDFGKIGPEDRNFDENWDPTN